MLLKHAARTVITGSLAGLAFLGLLFALGPACATWPTPVPNADAGQVDAPAPSVFTGQVFDCREPVVAVERESARIEVGACLRGEAPGTCPAEPIACLACEARQYNPTTVACVARDMGADANAEALANPADAVAKAMADAARSFVLTENLGYR